MTLVKIRKCPQEYVGDTIGFNFCLMSLRKKLCLLFCFRVGVDPEEEDRKSAYVSVSIVGFVFRNMEGIFFQEISADLKEPFMCKVQSTQEIPVSTTHLAINRRHYIACNIRH